MAGRFALRAEILGGLDQAGAEIRLPEAIHGDARGQRIARDRPASARGPGDWRARRRAAAAGTRGRRRSPCRRASRTRRACSTKVSRGVSISCITMVVGILFSMARFSASQFGHLLIGAAPLVGMREEVAAQRRRVLVGTRGRVAAQDLGDRFRHDLGEFVARSPRRGSVPPARLRIRCRCGW